MTMPIDLVLVRHGESEGNLAIKRGDRGDFTEEFLKRHSSKWRLTDKGRRQAKKAGEWIRENIGKRFDRYYVSEYLRAMETAALLNLSGARWHCDFYLRECDRGQLDVIEPDDRAGRFAEEFERRDIDSFFWAPAGGESLAQLCFRIDRVLDTFHRECYDKKVMIVCHGLVMWAFRIRIERISQRRYHELDKSGDPYDKIHNCQIFHYTRRNPKTGEIAPHLDWIRSICPTDLSRSRNEWEEIKRKKYTNRDLIDEVKRTKQLIVK